MSSASGEVNYINTLTTWLYANLPPSVDKPPDVKRTYLQDIIIGSKSKKELIKKLSKDDPEYLIENLQNIEHVADIIYEPQKNIKKRKNEEEFSSFEEETEKQRPKKNTRVKKELAKEEIDDTNEIMKIVGDKWKTDIEKS
ncbi:hypothetical protein F8M41_010667 [Gigaspora margarita]|uniref:Uncharacterized protein n=1 Tax=Gigaspora margarita TaxID=4874 RepID=A0A8H3X0A9_GIGMA|nr:hypothetical protein F8M41_010667 [Gigaspora margarita]